MDTTYFEICMLLTILIVFIVAHYVGYRKGQQDALVGIQRYEIHSVNGQKRFYHKAKLA